MARVRLKKWTALAWFGLIVSVLTLVVLKTVPGADSGLKHAVELFSAITVAAVATEVKVASATGPKWLHYSMCINAVAMWLLCVYYFYGVASWIWNL